MLGHWRIVLRQAEEAARVGRFEEAYALANRPDVADHHHAVQFRSRLALDLIARATRRGVGRRSGRRHRRPGPGRADRRTSRFAGRGPAQPGRPGGRRGPRRPGRRRAGPGAGADRGPGAAQDQRPGAAAVQRDRRGLAGRAWPKGGAASSAGRRSSLTGPSGWPAGAGAIAAQQAVAAAKAELENRQKGAAPKVEALYTALSEGKWPPDPLGGRGRAGDRPRAPGGAAGALPRLAADRGDRSGGRGAVARTAAAARRRPPPRSGQACRPSTTGREPAPRSPRASSG